MSIRQAFEEHAQVLALAARELPPVLEPVAQALHACLASGHQVLACGNGGSAADASHFVAELVGRFREERRALPAIALASDPATLTALGNDYGYEQVFARQVEAYAHPGDLLFAISTSGRSANVLQAARSARQRACRVIALTGAQGGPLAELADFAIRAPSATVARIQEIHGLCIHAITERLDDLLRGADAP